MAAGRARHHDRATGRDHFSDLPPVGRTGAGPHRILIEVDGTTLVELDKINPTFKVNGVDLLQKVREMT